MREVVKELVKSAEGDPFRFCAMCRRLVVALRARSPKGSHPIVRAAIGLSDGDRTTLLAALKTWVGLETWEAVMDATSSITGDMTAATLLKNVYGDMLVSCARILRVSDTTRRAHVAGFLLCAVSR